MLDAKPQSKSTRRTGITLRSVVKLPCGSILSVADLPPHPFIHWTKRDKWIVANAVRFGLISYRGACHRYRMHPDELDDWIAKVRAGEVDRLQQKFIRAPAPRSDGSSS